MGRKYRCAGDVMGRNIDHILAYRNSLLADEQGRYVLGDMLLKLKFFDICETESDMTLRNAALELLDDCGIVLLASDDNGRRSIKNFIEAISRLDVTGLIEMQAEEEKKTQKQKDKPLYTEMNNE